MTTKKKTKIYRRIAREVIKNKGMVVQQAFAAYRRLPLHTKQWIDLEDFIQEGFLEGMTTVARRFNPKKKTKLTTYLYTGLSLFYKNLLEPHYADMRYEGRTCNTEDLLPGWDRAMTSEELVQLSGIEHEPEENPDTVLTNAQLAQRELLKIFRAASPHLKKMMVTWFIQPKETKFHGTGKRFTQARDEFLNLCSEYGVGRDVCAAVMHSNSLKAQLAVEVVKEIYATFS